MASCQPRVRPHSCGLQGLVEVSPLGQKLVFKDGNDNVSKTGLTEKDGAYNIQDTWNCHKYEDLHFDKITRHAAECTPRGSEITQKPEQLLRQAIEARPEKTTLCRTTLQRVAQRRRSPRY